MSVQLITSQNIAPKKMIPSRQAENESQRSAFGHGETQKVPTKVKVGVFLTTLAGVSAVMIPTLAKKKILTNPFKTNPKNWGIFNIKYDENELGPQVVKLTLGSVGGGLLGGILFDKKENRNAKIREAIIQSIGNSFTPLLCVVGGIGLYKKCLKQGVIKALNLTKKTEGIPEGIASIICLVSGIFLGNSVGNLINEKVFGVKDKRKIRLDDMSPNIDDMATAISLVASESESKFAPVVCRVIPAALMVAGVSTGLAQEKPELLSKEPKTEQNTVAS